MSVRNIETELKSLWRGKMGLSWRGGLLVNGDRRTARSTDTFEISEFLKNVIDRKNWYTET